MAFCCTCGEKKGKLSFSKSQLSKRKNIRRCKLCVTNKIYCSKNIKSLNLTTITPKNVISIQIKNLSELQIDLLISGYVTNIENMYLFEYPIPSYVTDIIYRYYYRHYGFIQHDTNCYKISADGLTAHLLCNRFAVAQFGPYFNAKYKFIYTFSVKWLNLVEDGGHNIAEYSTGAIGFINRNIDAFNRYYRLNYYTRIPGHKSLRLDGKIISSKYFDTTLDITKPYNPNILGTTIHGNWYDDGDEIMVKINTQKMNAILWNSTKLNKVNINMDDININTEKYIFIFDFPNDADIAFAIDMSRFEQIVRVTQQNIKCIL